MIPTGSNRDSVRHCGRAGQQGSPLNQTTVVFEGERISRSCRNRDDVTQVRRNVGLSERIRTPADDFAVALQSNAMHRACCDFGNIKKVQWNLALKVVVVSPGDHGARGKTVGRSTEKNKKNGGEEGQ